MTWHKEGSHQALLVGSCREHVGALVPSLMVRQEEYFTQAPGSIWAAEKGRCGETGPLRPWG